MTSERAQGESVEQAFGKWWRETEYSVRLDMDEREQSVGSNAFAAGAEWMRAEAIAAVRTYDDSRIVNIVRFMENRIRCIGLSVAEIAERIRSAGARLDAHLTREPRVDESELWCPICDVPSKECILPETGYECVTCGQVYPDWGEYCAGDDGHAPQWITLAERAREQALSDTVEREHDAEETL